MTSSGSTPLDAEGYVDMDAFADIDPDTLPDLSGALALDEAPVDDATWDAWFDHATGPDAEPMPAELIDGGTTVDGTPIDADGSDLAAFELDGDLAADTDDGLDAEIDDGALDLDVEGGGVGPALDEGPADHLPDLADDVPDDASGLHHFTDGD